MFNKTITNGVMMQRAERVAKLLLENKCLQLSPSDPFSYASGLKGPIYCDNRQLLSFVGPREEVVKLFVEAIKESGWDYELLAGLATAGIPHCAFIAHEIKAPMIYIRGKAKEHGKQNQIEGKFKEGQRVVLVEDLINQGKSLEDALNAAVDAGLRPVGVLSIVTYEMKKAQEVLNKFKIPLISLTNFSTISSLALEQKDISADEFDMLNSWQKDPKSWSV
jgi:orotate phosphoribosyltransferase